MGLLNVRGVDVNVLEDGGWRSTHDRSSPRRILTGHVVEDSSFRDMWTWVGRVGLLNEDDRRLWVLFLDGAGETWMFTSGSNVGSRGSVPNAGGTYTLYGSGGEYNGRVEVGSGSYIELPSDIVPDDGWAVRFYTDDGGGAAPGHYVVWGTGTNVAAATVFASKDGAAAVQASTLGIDNVLSVASDGDVRLIGKTLAGVNAAVNYSEPEIRDYTLSSAIAAGLSGVVEECYPLPYHRMKGEGHGPKLTGVERSLKVRMFVAGEEVRYLDGEYLGVLDVAAMTTRL